jgi:hypothetical protein
LRIGVFDEDIETGQPRRTTMPEDRSSLEELSRSIESLISHLIAGEPPAPADLSNVRNTVGRRRINGMNQKLKPSMW